MEICGRRSSHAAPSRVAQAACGTSPSADNFGFITRRHHGGINTIGIAVSLFTVDRFLPDAFRSTPRQRTKFREGPSDNSKGGRSRSTLVSRTRSAFAFGRSPNSTRPCSKTHTDSQDHRSCETLHDLLLNRNRRGLWNEGVGSQKQANYDQQCASSE